MKIEKAILSQYLFFQIEMTKVTYQMMRRTNAQHFIILGSSACEIWANKSKLCDFLMPPTSLKIGQIVKKTCGDIALRYNEKFFE
jgi:hypothetical protein